MLLQPFADELETAFGGSYLLKGTAVKSRTGLPIAGAVAVLFLSGCIRIQTFNPDEQVFARFYTTRLGQSTSAEVLGYLQNPENELLSQSESVAASWGEKDKGQTHWFNMAAFDEEDLTAVRKYAFSLMERRLHFNAPPRPTLRFDASLMLSAEVLKAEYSSQNARYIAVLDAVRERFHDDTAEVTGDSQVLQSSAVMVNQALNAVLRKLGSSPAFAAYLPRPEGVEFEHPVLGLSYIRMIIEGDIVNLKVKAGKSWFHKPFEEHPDVQNM